MRNTKHQLLRILGACFGIALLFLVPIYAGASSLSAVEILTLINKERSQYNLPPLIQNYTLSIAAEKKLADMQNRNYFAHASPSGLMPWDFMESANYNFSFAGENLAQDYLSSAEVVKAWMVSPTHRKNILNPNFQDTAIAIATTDHILIVEFFGSRQGQASQPVQIKIVPTIQPLQLKIDPPSPQSKEETAPEQIAEVPPVATTIITNIRSDENLVTFNQLLKDFVHF